jgi:hypothetical protein
MRTLFIYLTLVGLPGLGILGVLRAGDGLNPPASVGGSWSVELGGPGDASCAGQLLGSGPRVMSVSQSGTQLVLSLGGEGGARLSGEIERGDVSAESSAPRGDEAGGRAPVRLRAALDGRERLRGSLFFEKCPGDAAVSFTATREGGPRAKGK